MVGVKRGATAFFASNSGSIVEHIGVAALVRQRPGQSDRPDEVEVAVAGPRVGDVEQALVSANVPGPPQLVASPPLFSATIEPAASTCSPVAAA